MPTIHPDTRIGHVHLKVSDIERALTFYRDLLGFEVVKWYEDSAVFLSAGGYHHHIGLNTWQSKGGSAPAWGTTGLFHTAILLPNREELAAVVKRLREADYPILGASDHGVSIAVYLQDPDQNGVELYIDRPRKDWPRDAQGKIAMVTQPFDIESL